jgi:hypothetical protein
MESQVELLLTGDITDRSGKSEQMVPIRRSGLHHRGFSHGVGHGTGSRIPLFWSRTKKVGSIDDLGLHGFLFHHHLPMVLLGLFFGIFTIGNKWIYR